MDVVGVISSVALVANEVCDNIIVISYSTLMKFWGSLGFIFFYSVIYYIWVGVNLMGLCFRLSLSGLVMTPKLVELGCILPI